MIHNWEIHVEAGSYYPSLSDHFPGDDIYLSYKNEDHCGMQFSAFSPHIDVLTDGQDVGTRLFSLQLLLNGALRLEWGNCDFMPISFHGFHNLNGNNSSHQFNAPVEEYPFKAGSENAPRPARRRDPKQRLSSYLLYLSKSDEAVRNILFLVGMLSTNTPIEKILSWGTLYKIFDCVNTYAGDAALDTSAFADQNDIKRFTAACNNMSIIGLNSRHGASSNTPPKRIINNYDEAQSLIIDMSRKFICAYINVKNY